MRQVLSEDPAPPSRLNASVPRDLETICLKCLLKDAHRRYTTAAALADDLNRFLRDQPIAARRVGRPERALRWMRRNPTATALIFTAALLLGLAAAAGLREWRLAMRRTAESEQWSERLAHVIELQERGDFDEARGILEQPDAGDAHIRERIEQARANLDLVERLDAIRLSGGETAYRGTNMDDAGTSYRYGEAFREWGLGDPREDPDRVAARLKASPVRKALVAALDDWATYAEKKDVRDWVLNVARRTDPDPWRDRVRDPDRWDRVESFPELADMARIEDQPVTMLVSFGTRWRRLGGDPSALLETVRRQHPDDFWVNMELGELFRDRDPAVAIRHLWAAEALRPDAASVHASLGRVLAMQGQTDDAIYHFERTMQINPKYSSVPEYLRQNLLSKGRTDEAAAGLKRSLALDPSAGRQFNEEWRAEWRQFIDRDAKVHYNWDGYAEFCLFLGDVAEYHRACREILARFESITDPRVCEVTGRACLLLPETPQQMHRAAALIDRALAADKSQHGLPPYMLFVKGLAEYRGNNLRSAIAILEGDASQVLGPAPRIIRAMARYRSGEREEARRTLVSAVIDYDWRAASADVREIWIYHVLRREAEAMLFPNLPAFLEGTYQPSDPWERLAFVAAAEFDGLTRASARLYADAFAAEPSLAADPERAWRDYTRWDPGRRSRGYLAACMAASAGCGRGQDASNLDDPERARLRDQARGGCGPSWPGGARSWIPILPRRPRWGLR